MPITFSIGVTSGDCRPITHDDLKALELKIMSLLSDKIAAVATAIDEVKARVEAAVPSQADLDALDAAKTSLDGIAPANPVEPPLPEPTPEPTPAP